MSGFAPADQSGADGGGRAAGRSAVTGDASKAYFDANPQAATDLRVIQRPVTTLTAKCKLPISLHTGAGAHAGCQQNRTAGARAGVIGEVDARSPGESRTARGKESFQCVAAKEPEDVRCCPSLPAARWRPSGVIGSGAVAARDSVRRRRIHSRGSTPILRPRIWPGSPPRRLPPHVGVPCSTRTSATSSQGLPSRARADAHRRQVVWMPTRRCARRADRHPPAAGRYPQPLRCPPRGRDRRRPRQLVPTGARDLYVREKRRRPRYSWSTRPRRAHLR